MFIRLIRLFLIFTATGLLTACAVPTAPSITGEETKTGTAYLGIEYAKADRWALPELNKNWQDKESYRSFGPSCPQDGQKVMDEACLYLNVFTPVMAKKAPVMVWIHGGGLRAGSGGDGPKIFTQDGFVVVTFNYRLGLLGFKDWPGWDEGDPRNFGQADMVAVLDWVQNNISKFGGNPDNVTIAGHSAGGMGVQLMMVDPRARGKFHKAIAHAGYGAWPFPKAYNPTPEERTRIRYAGLETDLSAAELVAKTPYFHLPYIGGADLTEQPIDSFRKGAQAALPYLAGANSLDGAGTLEGAGFSPESFLRLLEGRDDFLTAYADDFSISKSLAAARIFGDRRYVHSAWASAQEMSKLGQQAYLFYYDAKPDGQAGAYHGAQYNDIFMGKPTATRKAFAEFAKTGRVEGWPDYNLDDDLWMVFTPEATIVQSPLGNKLSLLDSFEFKPDSPN